MNCLISQSDIDYDTQEETPVVVDHTHIPVMVQEAVAGMRICDDSRVLDATFGRGGHSKAIRKELGVKGVLWVLDRDPSAIATAQDMALDDSRIRVISGRMSELDDLGGLALGQLDGALIDFGVSSPQIDDASRGFSFKNDGPLDMRMNNDIGLTAEKWLARASYDEIVFVLSTYGEEKYADKIAEKICAQRVTQPLKRTKDLVDAVLASVPSIKSTHHPATKVFQAIRMQINDEWKEMVSGLPIVVDKLRPGGRLVTITYHSLEHKTVSDVLKKRSLSTEVPYKLTSNLPQIRRVGSAQTPSPNEVRENARARSALLRIWEKKNG